MARLRVEEVSEVERWLAFFVRIMALLRKGASISASYQLGKLEKRIRGKDELDMAALPLVHQISSTSIPYLGGPADTPSSSACVWTKIRRSS
jgi:hypothetical protein